MLGPLAVIVLVGVIARRALDRVVMNKKLLLIIGIVVLVVAVPLIQARMRGGGAVEVQVETLAPRSIQSSVLASGKLVHEEEVKLSTEEIGRVTAIYVDEGQKVTRGELVLQIDDQRLRAAVDQQQAVRAHAGDRDPAPAAAGREPAHAMEPHAGAARAQAHRRGQLRRRRRTTSRSRKWT